MFKWQLDSRLRSPAQIKHYHVYKIQIFHLYVPGFMPASICLFEINVKIKICVFYFLMYLMEHISRQENHGEIVTNQNHFEVNRFPVFHQTGPGPDRSEVNQEDESHWDRGEDQQPGVGPLVWGMRGLWVRDITGDVNWFHFFNFPHVRRLFDYKNKFTNNALNKKRSLPCG